MTTGRALIDAEVRELVHRRGIDPVAEPAVVARLVDDVVAEYLDRATTSALPPLGNTAALSRTVLDAVAGFGPLQPLLDDPSVEEVWINEPGRVFIARRGRSELTTLILTAGEVTELVERMLRTTGRRIDLSTPFVDAMLPDGSRLHVVIPSITRRHLAVNIRKFLMSLNSLDELVSVGTLSEQAARFLEAAVVAGLNVLVAGGTQAGKTTLLNALCSAIPARERVVTVEEVFELQVALPDVVAMQTRQPNLEGTGEIALRRLVKEALRMRPSRLIVGEVRQEERHRRPGYQEEVCSGARYGVGIPGCEVADASGDGLRGHPRAVAGRVVRLQPLRGRLGAQGFRSSPQGSRRVAFGRLPRRVRIGRACVLIRRRPLIARTVDRP